MGFGLMASMLALMLFSLVVPATAEAESQQIGSISEANSDSLGVWMFYLVVNIASLAILFLYINRVKTPEGYSAGAIVMYTCLTVFAVFLILVIAYLPTSLFGATSPLSRAELSVNGTGSQWVLNVGGVVDNPKSLGLQIPLFVIIAGILGAFIRYLYIGITEFKGSFKSKLQKLNESYRLCTLALHQYNAHTSQCRTLENFDQDSLYLNKEPDEVKGVNYPITEEELKAYPNQKTITYCERRRFLWNRIHNAKFYYDEACYAMDIDITSYILKTAGSLYLGPLLAVIGWLLLSITGSPQDSVWTFALVGFSVGLAAKTIINKMLSTVEGKLPADEESKDKPDDKSTDDNSAGDEDKTASMTVDPSQAIAGQIVTLEGQGLPAESDLSLEYSYDGKSGVIGSPRISSKGNLTVSWKVPEMPSGECRLKGTYLDGKEIICTLLIK
jgi:hypothetical protein